eukprot:TRINITY_DN36075_c0_g1_i1.p1 TRINITY_DN36075_c0_g1~~TRINITY_DN36075_c0_g1_i1.p1  ORF type:complete len:267 (+),score=112.76 TRINITY_DN36075_c0_g1_i1:50-802(+)
MAAAAAESGLTPHYCLRCGALAVLGSEYLARCPRRRSDGSFVVGDEHLRRTHLNKGSVRDVLWASSVERQYALNCSHCNIEVGYRSKPVGDLTNQLTYVLPGIVSANPALSLSLVGAERVVVPDCIQESGSGLVTVSVRVTYGAHTTVQVADVVPQAVVLQVRRRYEGNDIKVNEAVKQFFGRLLSLEKHHIQLLAGQQSGDKRVSVERVSKGFLFAQLLRAMMLLENLLPSAGRDDAALPARKRPRSGD